jgi:DNA repair protein RadC
MTSAIAKQTDDIIKKLIAEREQSADIGALSRSLLEQFGGHKGVARAFKMEFDESPVGGQNRTYLLRCLVELMKATYANEDKADPFAGLSPNELAAALQRSRANA